MRRTVRRREERLIRLEIDHASAWEATLPLEAISRVRGQPLRDFVPGEEALPCGLTEVTNDGGVEALVSFALPERVGGLHEQVFEGERRVIRSEAMGSCEPGGVGSEASGEQERFSDCFVGSARLGQLGRDARLSDVMSCGPKPNELAVEGKAVCRSARSSRTETSCTSVR